MAKDRRFVAIGEVRESNGKQFEILYGSQAYRQESANSKQGRVIGHVISGPIRPISGRLWFCSQELSRYSKLTIDETDQDFTELTKVIECKELRKYSGQYVSSFYGNVIDTIEKFSPNIYFRMLPVAN